MAVNDTSTGFGELLREYRRAAGLTQEELAERAGVSPRSVSELERGGAHVPRRDTVALLARALDLMGADRDAFEALVERRRKTRPARAALDRVPTDRPPPYTPVGSERTTHNLPRPLTSFIGREQELSELAPVLASAPLLTLVGAGGVGKTRLALELVRTHSDSFADGSWLVELAGLCDPSLVPGAVAAAVGLRDFHVRNLTQVLAEYLAPKRLLLVLDNCEHLVEACAELVAQLLRRCQYLQVLATSREPLAIEGEMTWRVQPLELPDTRQSLSANQINRIPAVRLFIERARAVNNTLALTDENAEAIARICVGVDGIPLALELAAARTRLLTVEQLAERLKCDDGVLGGTHRDGLPQHRTIRATIDWSHDLLGEQEQILLRRLSVFACGWTLDMAEEVCSGDGVLGVEILDLLAQLVDKSMALVDARETEARYRLLEPIRQYAAERLEASGEAPTYRSRHSTALLQFTLANEAGRAGPDEISSLDRFEVEHDNIRAALRWELTHAGSTLALRCSAALFRFWERRGHFQEGCAWLEQALANAPDAPASDQDWALNALAFLLWRGGKAERAQPIAERALALSLEAGLARDVAQALLNLGMIAYLRDEPEVGVARLEEGVRYARQAGYATQLSLALTFLARTLMRATGPHNPRLSTLLAESLPLAEAVGSRYATGHALMTCGDHAWRQGDVARAVRHWQRALVVRSELGDRRGIGGSIERLAWALAASDLFELAAWLFGAAESQNKLLGIELWHHEKIDHDHLVAVTHQQLGEAFAGIFSAGNGASVDEAVVRGVEGTRSLASDGQAKLPRKLRMLSATP